MGYPSDLLSSRAVVKPGMYAIIPPEGRVFNVIPGIEGCRMTILCTPKMGAGFVQHIGTALPGGGTTMPYGASGLIETFIYVLDGEGSLTVTVGGRTEVMPQGGYAYAPAGVGISFRNETDKPLRFLLYKQRYIPHPDPAMQPYAVFGNTNDIEERIYDNMENVFVRDLLPVDEPFDMNMHILSFAPGGCHPFVETHVQEHGAYVFCLPSVAPALLELEQVGRTGVKAAAVELAAVPVPERKVRPVTFTVQSARLDAVVSGMFRLSRTSAAAQIRAGAVHLNYTECLRPDAPVAPGDVLSLRGAGKGSVTEVGGISRKGRQFVTAELWQ